MIEYLKDTNLIRLPGFATAHSHAFQRALRGRTQRRADTPGSFWSWRGLMYELVEKLTPEDIFDISHFAFVELTMSGVTAVGEFHYVHHTMEGTPYSERTVLADAVIRAAKAAGIRITLIRTAYLRGGYRQEFTPAQKRFADHSLDPVLQDIERLQQSYKDDDMVGIAVAAHSIRAVPLAQVKELAQFARGNKLPLHMHVAEQRRELEECKLEYGKTPVAVLADAGVLDENFVAIHATHLSDDEIRLLGQAKATVCLCRTTERDLGDGLAPTSELIKAGAQICVGVDSHASSDAFEELRAIELDERSRTEARTVAAEAPALLAMGTAHGYRAIGRPDAWRQDFVYLNPDDPSLACSDHGLLADAVIFAGMPRAVQRVEVAGNRLVEQGRHINYRAALKAYRQSLNRMGLI